jgi:cytochrome c5
VRLLFSLFALGLAACSVDEDATNEHVTLKNEQKINRTATIGGLSAEPAAAGAEKITASPEQLNETVEEKATLDLRHVAPQLPVAQSSGAENTLRGRAAPVVLGEASLQDGRELVQIKCTTCHSLEIARVPQRNVKAWAEMVELMIGHGMVASDTERRLMQNYLGVCCLRPGPE